MKVLFIGGTGIISSACSELAVAKGIDLYHLNRGQSISTRSVQGVKHINADIRNEAQVRDALAGHQFDAVVDWIAFEPAHIEADIRLFGGIAKQFVFISSASIYQTPPLSLPVTENTPTINPVWKYSQNKIACESLLRQAWKESGFPYTIVRPSHTYDKTLWPMECGYTVVDRMKKGKKIVVHGDGTSIWTLTHHRDFAKGLVGLLGKQEAVNEAYHITSDEWLSWNQIYMMVGAALGLTPDLVHVPSAEIAKFNAEIGDSLLGDKTHSMIFDNTKIKKLVPEFACTIPFAEGVKEIAAWYEADASRQIISAKDDTMFDDIIAAYFH